MLPIDDDGDPGVLLRIEAQPVRRPATLAQPHRHVGGIGGFGTVKPALRRPLGVSTNTRRRRCDIKPTIANGRVNGARRRLEINLRVEWEPAPGEPGRLPGM